MYNRDNIDLKLILAFTNAYQTIQEKGEITSSQLDRVLSLIDRYRELPPEEFAERLEEIFSE